MTSVGQVRFDVSRDAALRAGLWILIYGAFDRDIATWRPVARIGERLFGAWKRKPHRSSRADRIEISLSREQARWLAMKMPARQPTIIGSGCPIERGAAEVKLAALRAITGKRGRPKLSRARLKQVERDAAPPASTWFRHEGRRRMFAAKDRAQQARSKALFNHVGTILRVSPIPE